MKVQIISAIKKISAALIASLMVLGIIPIGLLALPTTVNAEDEFLRLSPDREVCLSPMPAGSEAAMEKPDEGIYFAGENYDGYMRFDIRGLHGRDIDNLHDAKLRFVVMKGSIDAPLVRIYLMQDNDWDKDTEPKDAPSSIGDIIIGEVVPMRDNFKDAVVEIDLVDYMKKWLEEEREYVSFRIDTSHKTIQYAGSNHQDPALRPCLKVVTGAAVDPDSNYLSKSVLHAAAVDGNRNKSAYHIPEGQSLYLNFALNKNNIKSSAYRSFLKLVLLTADEGASIKIYQIENTDWASSAVSNLTPPEGKEHLIYTIENPTKSSLGKIDLTDIVNESLKAGLDKIGFRINAQNGSITLGGGEDKPYLDIKVSDREDIVAVTEASVNCLGKNADIKSITKNLPDEYSGRNNKKVDIEWSAYDTDTGEEIEETISRHGEIKRPHWYRESKTILAVAKMSCGSYKRERGFYLTLLPEDAPDYKDATFDNALTPGNTKDENQHCFESLNTESHSRYIGGHIFEYEELKADGTMVLNLAVNKDEQNFITLKLWGADAFSGFEIKNLNNPSAEPIIISPDEKQLKNQDGFVYLTYPLPKYYTEGKDYVSLKLEGLSAEEASQYIYGVYITDTPYFDPLTFADQGETLVKRLNRHQSFQQRIKALAKKPLMFFRKSDVQATEDIYTVDIDGDQSVLINTRDESLAISIPDSGITEINRENAFYSSYSKADVEHHGDLRAVDYGKYQIFRNTGKKEQKIPQKKHLSGVYQDMVTGEYYSFLGGGETADVSVLPKGTKLNNGKDLSIGSEETIVLNLVAKPLYSADWRVGQINECPVSKLNFVDSMIIRNLTIRNLGHNTEETTLDIICNVYERGILVGMEKVSIETVADRTEMTVNLKNALELTPGRTLKVFITNSGDEPHKMIPKLELP